MQPVSNAYHTDCMLFMPQFPDNFWDLGIPDPPYGIKEDGRKTRGRSVKKDGTYITKIDKRNGIQMIIKPQKYGNNNWDNQPPPDEYFTELKRVTKNQIIWGANYFPAICGTTFKAPRRKDYAQFMADHPTNWIIWDKVNGDNDFSDCELAWTSFDVSTQVFYFMWAGMLQGLSITHGTTMQGNKQLNEKRIHPTQKPLPLYQWQLQKFAKPGDKILDTHMGGAGSRIAAYKLGFDYWGTEISKTHYDDGCARFLRETDEPLFSK